MKAKLAMAIVPIAVLASLLASMSCRPRPSPTVFLDPALAVLAPADTTLLAGIRMQRIRATPLREEVEKSPRLNEFRKSIGIAGESDIWEFLIASNGSRWIALMRGKFTEMGMEPRVNKPLARRESRNGVTIVGDEKGAIAFLNPTTAIAGSFDAVLRTVEQRNDNSGIPDGLLKIAEAIPAGNDVWFASMGPAPPFLPVSQIRSGRGGFEPRSKIADFLVEAESEGAANSIAEALNGSAEGTRVTAHGPAPERVIDWLLGRSVRIPATR